MVYRLPAGRGPARRVAAAPGPEGTDQVVETHRIRCSHFDAYRFFTAPARPRNPCARPGDPARPRTARVPAREHGPLQVGVQAVTARALGAGRATVSSSPGRSASWTCGPRRTTCPRWATGRCRSRPRRAGRSTPRPAWLRRARRVAACRAGPGLRRPARARRSGGGRLDSGPHQRVGHTVHQRLPGRLDDVVRRPRRSPTLLAVGQSGSELWSPRRSRGRVEDADAVVDQVELLHHRVRLPIAPRSAWSAR